jgi:alpha-beta hydrolase superfamily lysophospholipase
MDEASSRFVDRLAVDKLLQEKLSRVHHRQPSPLPEATPPVCDQQGLALRSFPAAQPRATVLFAHGLYEDQSDIYRFLFTGLNRLGYTVELFFLPYHYQRKPADSLFGGEFFFSANLHRTRQAFLQASLEMSTCHRRLVRERRQPIFLAGFSMGGTIALQAAARLHDVPGVCLINPPAGLADLIWTSPLCQTIRADIEADGLDRAAVAAYFRDIDPAFAGVGSVDRQRVLMVQALYDLVTRQEQYEALAKAWQFPHRLKVHAGHLNTLRVPRLAEDMARFFDTQMPRAGQGCP